MKKIRITAAALIALSLVTSFTACSSDDRGDLPNMTEEQTTTAVTVEINTATMAAEQQEQVEEGKELFYIGGLYEIESDPEIWTKTFGATEDVFFVPVPRDEQADAYYYNAEFECYNLCKGAQNPEGFARLMECVIASVYDENAIQINNDKHKQDFSWTDEMIELRDEVSRLTKENPVRDVYGGMPTDVSGLISNAFNSPIQGGDWFEQRDSINELVDLSVQEVNDFIVSASN